MISYIDIRAHRQKLMRTAFYQPSEPLLSIAPDSAVQSTYYAIRHNQPEVIIHEEDWNLKAEKALLTPQIRTSNG